MRLFYGLSAVKQPLLPSAVTIGNFDGVHIGHQRVLSRLRQEANARNLAMTVVVFEPQPREFFGADEARLYSLRAKLEAFAAHGVDTVLCLPFNANLAKTPAETFAKTYFFEALTARYILVGEDFCFGAGRQGNVTQLADWSTQHGIDLAVMPTVEDKTARISSTRIRKALLAGDFASAEAMLGRPYSLTGRVVTGAKRGREFGFPTANLACRPKNIALSGVYFTWMLLEGEARPYASVTNIGIRPTVDGTRRVIETHLLDAKLDLYGRRVCLQFCQKWRDEQKFDNLDLLKAAIGRDVDAARRYFAQTTSCLAHLNEDTLAL